MQSTGTDMIDVLVSATNLECFNSAIF